VTAADHTNAAAVSRVHALFLEPRASANARRGYHGVANDHLVAAGVAHELARVSAQADFDLEVMGVAHAG
jgi:hypothetical protein